MLRTTGPFEMNEPFEMKEPLAQMKRFHLLHKANESFALTYTI